MRHPSLPDARQRIQAAHVHGEVQRLCFGQDQLDRQEWGVARLHEITTDPVVLGHDYASDNERRISATVSATQQDQGR